VTSVPTGILMRSKPMKVACQQDEKPAGFIMRKRKHYVHSPLWDATHTNAQ
jgi:hypothetical protein